MRFGLFFNRPAAWMNSTVSVLLTLSRRCVLQLFYSFFKSLVGKDVVVELKNDLRLVFSFSLFFCSFFFFSFFTAKPGLCAG